MRVFWIGKLITRLLSAPIWRSFRFEERLSSNAQWELKIDEGDIGRRLTTGGLI